VILFYAGIAFAYYVVFPLMFKFFTATAPPGVQMMTDMTQYMDFVLVLFMAFGLAFEIPVAIVLLVWTGLVKLETLRKNRGYVLIAVFVQAAVITPPDVISQTAMALPMYALYEIGIVMARILVKTKLEQRAREEQEEREAGA
jgi:sec-independent protein translocase protein TatC